MWRHLRLDARDQLWGKVGRAWQLDVDRLLRFFRPRAAYVKTLLLVNWVTTPFNSMRNPMHLPSQYHYSLLQALCTPASLVKVMLHIMGD